MLDATVSGASLGLVAEKSDAGGAGTPGFALLATGNVSLSGAGTVALTGTGWQVEYDSLGDLSGAPITVPTGRRQPS